ncbi:MAG: RdgB/HAM1 family non-canonical purine NTP pyrophosphatase [Fluviicola sp.]
MKLIFASHNAHKVDEIRSMLPEHFELLSLTDLGYHDEIPETADTISGNAIMKAEFLSDKLQEAVFADDTGLVIPALNGEPGVFSARYAGQQKDPKANMEKVLDRLTEKADRSAYFQTVIALHMNGETHLFDGRVHGKIIEDERGGQGFGYDPIFVPEGHELTFAEMDAAAKNAISHRARALRQMLQFLSEYDNR